MANVVMEKGKLLCCSTLFIITLASCAGVYLGLSPSSLDKTASSVFDQPATTLLGQAVGGISSSLSTPSDQSGFLLLDRGRDALSWRLILADAAQKSIDAQYFLWKNDAVGKVMMQRLLAAAKRGARVRVLIDDSMTESDPQYLALFGGANNVQVRIYKPFGPKRQSVLRWVDYAAHMKVIDRRMHNKIFTVDSALSVIGGRNIANEYLEYPGKFVFRSRDLLALGPVVENTGSAFDMYWNSSWSVPIEQVVSHVPTADEVKANTESLKHFAAQTDNYPVGFFDDPKRLNDELLLLERQLLWGEARLLVDQVPPSDDSKQKFSESNRTGVELGKAVDVAGKEVLIQSPYLIPELSGDKELKKLIAKGVTVKLATNSMAANNHLSAFVAYRKQREALLKAGAEIYEMRPDTNLERTQFSAQSLKENDTFFGLHAKTMVFDRKTVFIGSFNLDPRSLHLNTEMGLLVQSETLAAAVADSINVDISAGNSWRVRFDANNDLQWVTIEQGKVTEHFDNEPMTSVLQRLEADALYLIPDTSEM
jgi:putative cardiolipin synthase